MKKPFIIRQIRAREVRLVNETGEQLGLIPLADALERAKDAGLDLIQVTEKVDPPVCKIADFGKYLYAQKKKDKKIKVKPSELKNIRLTFNISDNDLQTRAKTAIKFLNDKDKVRVEVILRGRQKGLEQVGREKAKKFLTFIEEQEIEIKIEKELKKQPRGLTMIISKK